jgi:hypothetical protein
LERLEEYFKDAKTEMNRYRLEEIREAIEDMKESPE